MFIEILAYDAPDLYYYRARYYDPNTTRFLSQDPIEFLSGDFNFYRYVGSDPVNYKDPSGLAIVLAIPLVLEVAAVVGAVAVRAAPIILRALQAARGIGRVPSVPGTMELPDLSGEDTVIRDKNGDITWTADNDGTTKPTAAVEGADVDTGALVKGEKGKSDCGEQKGYKDSQKENYAQREDGLKMDRDHIPAKQYMIEKARIMAEEMDITFNKCIEKAIINEAKTIMIPKTMHRMGQSYGKTGSASGDLSSSANDVAKKDIDTYRDLMDKDNPTNKKGNPLTSDEKKKMDDIDDDCKEKIKEGLKEMEKEDYDKFLEDKINENQICK